MKDYEQFYIFSSTRRLTLPWNGTEVQVIGYTRKFNAVRSTLPLLQIDTSVKIVCFYPR